METDWKKLNEQWDKERRERQAASNKAAKPVLDELAKMRITKITFEYDGQGDSGQIETVTYFKGKQEVKEPEFLKEPAEEAPPAPTYRNTKADQLERLVYDALEVGHAGWEINDGSFGTVTLDVKKRKLHVQHNERETISHESEEEIDV